MEAQSETRPLANMDVAQSTSSISSGVSSRLSFQRTTSLIQISSAPSRGGYTSDDHPKPPARRFMSTQPAWVPGEELESAYGPNSNSHLPPYNNPNRAVYGAFCFIMAPLAAMHALQLDGISNSPFSGQDFSVQNIHGTFSARGLPDRPFIFSVQELATTKSFCTRLVTARQPTTPSVLLASGDFDPADGTKPLGDVGFSCVCSFMRPERPRDFPSAQIASPWSRFADILNSRPAAAWPEVPSADLDLINDVYTDQGPTAFPILDMRKVDMTEWKSSRPIPEGRELLLYRLREPLPLGEANKHFLAHAFAADRNGVLMLANNLDLGSLFLSRAATLNWSFFVHVNPEDAVMRYDVGADSNSESGGPWWIMEAEYPRAGEGRGMMTSWIWSPEGVHVATGHQDGLIRVMDADRAKL